MAIFIGLFIWKNDPLSPAVNPLVTVTSSRHPVSTQSYIAALTNATQTEIDTLSACELILQQFQADYPYLKKLHKRTDNEGNFSSHRAPQS